MALMAMYLSFILALSLLGLAASGQELQQVVKPGGLAESDVSEIFLSLASSAPSPDERHSHGLDAPTG